MAAIYHKPQTVLRKTKLGDHGFRTQVSKGAKHHLAPEGKKKKRKRAEKVPMTPKPTADIRVFIQVRRLIQSRSNMCDDKMGN